VGGFGLISLACNWLFNWLLRPREQVISFRLPLCGDCQKKDLEIARFDWDDYCVLAYCHPGFCDALKSQTGRGGVDEHQATPDSQESQEC
jgi:hypothetical protein